MKEQKFSKQILYQQQGKYKRYFINVPIEIASKFDENEEVEVTLKSLKDVRPTIVGMLDGKEIIVNLKEEDVVAPIDTKDSEKILKSAIEQDNKLVIQRDLYFQLIWK